MSPLWRRMGPERERVPQILPHMPLLHVTYTCPKCGLTRTLRSNSRIGLCPVCDRYVDSRPKTQFDDFRPKEAGVSDIIRIWTDGEGLTLVYVDNGRGMTYLYAEGDLVGSINFSSWCRNNKLSM